MKLIIEIERDSGTEAQEALDEVSDRLAPLGDISPELVGVDRAQLFQRIDGGGGAVVDSVGVYVYQIEVTI